MAGNVATVAGHRLDRSTVPLLVTLGLGVFAGALDLGVLSPALTALGASFGVGARELPWVFTLYLLANVVSIPIMTSLADRHGRRPIYIACVAIFAAGSVVAIAAPSFPIFLFARAVQAFGAGGIFPVAAAAIGDRVPAERRGAALGLVAATWGLAAVIGPNVGGIITHLASWHWIFAANVPLAAVVIMLARTTLPAAPARVRGPLDVPGIVLLAAGLLAVMLGLTGFDVANRGNDGRQLAELVAGLVLLAAFGWVERSAREPVIPPRFFRDGQLRLVYGLEILIGILEGALFFVPAALMAAQGLSSVTAGAVAAVGALTFVTVIPAAGRALDRVGSRAVLAVGSSLTAVGLGAFAWALGSFPAALVAMVIAGAGFGALLGAPTRYIVTNRAGSEQRAAAVGLLSVCLILGQILGGSLAGAVVGSQADPVAGYRFGYETFAALAVLAALLTAALASRDRERAAR